MGIDLRLDWASYQAAKYAVEHWHYSHKLPQGKMVHIGVWENDSFVGVVLFGRGVSPNLGTQYGLKITEVCELVRVALTEHQTPVSRIVKVAIKLLRRQSPNLKLIVSFADPEQNHVGGIYQAMNWIYTGLSTRTRVLISGSKVEHERTAVRRMGTVDGKDLNWKYLLGKHRYLYPLDEQIKRQVTELSLPYPKKEMASGSET